MARKVWYSGDEIVAGPRTAGVDEALFEEGDSPKPGAARANLTRACELIAWEEWDQLRAHLRQA